MGNLLLDLRIASRSLFQHRRRTFFLGLAIAGVTALLVLLNSLSTGIRETMIRAATTLATGHVNVGGFFKVTKNAGGPVVTDYEKVIAAVRQSVPEMESLVHRGRGWAKLISDLGSTQAGITGLDIQNEPDFRRVIQLASGSLDELAQPNTMPACCSSRIPGRRIEPNRSRCATGLSVRRPRSLAVSSPIFHAA